MSQNSYGAIFMFVFLSLLILGRGAAMIIESLRLFYHLRCFQCCVCQVQLGSGNKGTDVRVRNNRLHCQNCYSNDEGEKMQKERQLTPEMTDLLLISGLKFSKV